MIQVPGSILKVLLMLIAMVLCAPSAILAQDCPQNCRDNGDFHRDTNTGNGWEIGTFHSTYTGGNCEHFEDHVECDGDAFVYDEASAQLVFKSCEDGPEATIPLAGTRARHHGLGHVLNVLRNGAPGGTVPG